MDRTEPANDGGRRTVGPLSPFSFFFHPIKLSANQFTGLSPFPRRRLLRHSIPVCRESPSESLVLINLVPSYPPPINGRRRRSAVRAKRVASRRQNSTVRETPNLFPCLNGQVTWESSQPRDMAISLDVPSDLMGVG